MAVHSLDLPSEMREVAEKGREERGKEGSRVEKRRRTGQKRGRGGEGEG